MGQTVIKGAVAKSARDLLHELGGPVENMPMEAVYRLLGGLQGLDLHLTPAKARTALLLAIVFAIDFIDVTNRR